MYTNLIFEPLRSTSPTTALSLLNSVDWGHFFVVYAVEIS